LKKPCDLSLLFRFYKYSSVVVFILAFIIILVSCDSSGKTGTITKTVTVTEFTDQVTNQPPVFSAFGDKSVIQGNLLEFILSATDPDGDYLIFNAINLPAGATFNSFTRTFSWLPQSAGTYSNISFSVSDGKDTRLQTINIKVSPNIPNFLNQPSTGTIPLSVFYYGVHTPRIDSLIIASKPQYVIINSANGLWGQISGRNILKDISIYHTAGIKVIGYITSGYEGTGSTGNIDAKWYTLEMNQTLIKNMALIDLLDGVFIDECSPFPSQSGKTYLKTLTNLAHSYGLITWGNVGLSQFDSWFFTQGDFDLMQSNENWQGQDLSPIQRDWGYRISVTGSNITYTAQDAFSLTLDAWKKGLAYCYIGDMGYSSIAPWFEEYAILLQKYTATSIN
jgi:hypothetical protein